MTETIQIKEYKPSHKEQVLALLRLNTPEYFDPSEEAALSHYLDQERELYYVVMADTEIVGCGGINFANDGTTGKISWDIIHPDHQGKSIGTKLLTYRIRLLESMENVQEITVRTSQHAYRFYEKSGFRLREVTKDYWAPGIDRYAMMLAPRTPSVIK